MSLYRIAGTVFFLFMGITLMRILPIPDLITGIFGVLAAIGLGFGI